MNKDKRYGSRILAAGIEVTNDTRLSGCNNNDLICGKSGSGKIYDCFGRVLDCVLAQNRGACVEIMLLHILLLF